MLQKSCPDLKIKVIVRAWGEEPVPMFVYRIENNRCYVGKESPYRVIGLPVGQVYLYDGAVFGQLMEAFQAGEKSRLDSMYSRLEIISPCNRYQDILESLHDQEHITDSRSAASGSEQ